MPVPSGRRHRTPVCPSPQADRTLLRTGTSVNGLSPGATKALQFAIPALLGATVLVVAQQAGSTNS